MDPGAILRFQHAQRALLERIYDTAWHEGVAGYEPDDDPKQPKHEHDLAPILAGGGLAALQARRQMAYATPSLPDPERRQLALAPALRGVQRMGRELSELTPTEAESAQALAAVRAGEIAAEDIPSYGLALAAAAWLHANEWRLTAGESVAWSGEQAGHAEAAEVDGQLLEWITEGDSRVCNTCEAFGSMGAAPLYEWPTVPGAGDTECGPGCRCVMQAVGGEVPTGPPSYTEAQESALNYVAARKEELLNSELGI